MLLRANQPGNAPPVIAPPVAPIAADGMTLFRHAGFRYAIFPRQGGHWPELGSEQDRDSIIGHHVDTILGYLELSQVYGRVFTEGRPYRQSDEEARALQFSLIPRMNKDEVVTEVLTIVKSRK